MMEFVNKLLNSRKPVRIHVISPGCLNTQKNSVYLVANKNTWLQIKIHNCSVVSAPILGKKKALSIAPIYAIVWQTPEHKFG